MATINGEIRSVSANNKVQLVTWPGLGLDDEGAAAAWVEFADRCFQVAGTFGVGGSLTVEGSNDGVNWSALSDPQGNALTFTTQKIEQALELPLFVRPVVTAGDETTDLTVTLCMRG